MHIPDGYLSPSTCAVLLAGAAPFWYASLRRLKQAVNTSLVPLVSVFSSFSFLAMMFNLPLPGGTTGHAVGMGVAAIVVGPWAAMLAISVALAIQAVFFGDGGITAIGANCFNMAIAGSLVAYAVYRAVAWRAGLQSRRRVVAAAAAGYAAINVSALLAAVEFGVQPLLFHDASGAPLYCPYPLSISIPAMMLGHLTFAGLAELTITAGVVAYLQRAEPSLLRLTAGDVSGVLPAPATRKLWWGLACVLVLTPLGILATGSAWGEWSASELAGQLHASAAPEGLRRWSDVWSAPVARYAPGFIGNEATGYAASAVMGVGIILLIGWGLRRLRPAPARTAGFVERTIRGLVKRTEDAIFAEEIANAGGFLQRLDARAKLAGLMALLLAAVEVRRMEALVGLFAFGVLVALVSGVRPGVLAQRVWLPVLAFTGPLAAPAIFLVPGGHGLFSAGLLLLRVETASTFAVLLVLCTPWSKVLKALRFFRVPVVVVVILGMTYRYLFLFLKAAGEMFESRQSRLVGPLPGAERRRVAAGTVGVLLTRSLQLSAEVHSAMLARGFHGEVHILDEPAVAARDWCCLAGLGLVAGAAMWMGR